MRTSDPNPAPVLLYDGECGFCNSIVQLVLRFERPGGALCFAKLQGSWGDKVRAEHPEVAGVDTVIWYDLPAGGRSARALIKSDASIQMMRYLGGVWALLGSLLALVPRFIRDFGYDAVARIRNRIRPGFCALPTAEQRSRFLD